MIIIVSRFTFLELGRDNGVPVHRVSADLGVFLNHQGTCANESRILNSGIRSARVESWTVLFWMVTVPTDWMPVLLGDSPPSK